MYLFPQQEALAKKLAQYNGKYQFQSSEPTPSKYEGK